MNDLTELMRQNVAAPPHDHLDLTALVGSGQRRVRRRRVALAGGVATFVVVVVIGAAAVAGIGMGPSRSETIARMPQLDAPTLRVDDAAEAVEGSDYRVVASHTNDNLERDNGQYVDGVTDDGLVLFRDGPNMDQDYPRYALMDPATGDKDWLPTPPDTAGRALDAPIELGSDRLVIPGLDSGLIPTPYAYVFDRDTRQWSVLQWPGLPKGDTSGDLPRAVMGPEDRMYVLLPATRGQSYTYDLWSASLTDQADVRDEGLTVGDLAFTDTSMVWTDATNDDAGLVHVRDLETGEETSFDPQDGDTCNVLDFGATGDWIVMGQYCGTYDDGVRDDRVQVLTTTGEQVVTIQDTDIDGGLDGANSDVVVLVSTDGDRTGTYVYDLSTGRFLRVSDSLSGWGMESDIAAGADQFIWNTPEGGNGSTQWLGELLP